MLNEHTLDQLKSLRLDGMVRAIEEQATSTAADALAFDERLARQLMSSTQAELTLSLAALSSRATRRSSRQAISRCTSSVSRSSKASASAAVLVACSSTARTIPSRRRLRN